MASVSYLMLMYPSDSFKVNFSSFVSIHVLYKDIENLISFTIEHISNH